jgi:ribosomal protein S12 methylthiotransferase
MRGRLASRRIGEVLTEAEGLAKSGVREILVISQDTSAYGLDLKYRTDFWQGRPLRNDLVALAGALGEVAPWIRLHYVYPYPHVDALLPLMAEGKVLPYLDVPLQHGVPRILKLMQRPAAAEKTLDRIRSWRKVCPELTIRSTFIVGFPGETEVEFEALLEFLTEANLDRVGCFAYSPVEGATANALPDPVPEAVKQERLERFMAHQALISTECLTRRVGQTIEVIIDAVDEEGVVARSKGDAPEIDGVVHVDTNLDLQPGDIIAVEITGSDTHDLHGIVADV